MRVQQLRNIHLKPGMYIKHHGTLKTVRKVSASMFNVAVVEFSNGNRAALNLQTTSTVVTLD